MGVVVWKSVLSAVNAESENLVTAVPLLDGTSIEGPGYETGEVGLDKMLG